MSMLELKKLRKLGQHKYDEQALKYSRQIAEETSSLKGAATLFDNKVALYRTANPIQMKEIYRAKLLNDRVQIIKTAGGEEVIMFELTKRGGGYGR